jgi:SAM-dependent methyltransferase
MAGHSPPASVAAFPPDWYDFSDERHFWMRWRYDVWRRRAGAVGIDLGSPARALDIGCGVGTFRRQVEADSPWMVDGAEPHPWARAHALPARGRLWDLDVLRPGPGAPSGYDHVFLFDVIEHVSRPRAFVRASARFLRPGGWLHVNVPALPSLYSAYDEAAGHLRRYTPATLARTVRGLGFKDIRIGYWGFGLLPALVARNWRVHRCREAGDVLRRGLVPPGAFVNALFRIPLWLETRLLPRVPLGTSVMLIARKAVG